MVTQRLGSVLPFVFLSLYSVKKIQPEGAREADKDHEELWEVNEEKT